MEDAGSGRNLQALETDKDRLIEELREAVRARDEFVAIAAHELRNPMTPVLMQASLLLSMVESPARCRPDVILPRVQQLEHAIQEFVRRATTLLDISRIAAGNVRIEPVRTDFSVVLRKVVSRASLAAQRAQCPLLEEVDPEIVGFWDPLALEQITENLLTNAIKFGAGKPVTIALRYDGQTARFTVRDRGIGISEEDRARIFQRFERAVTRREHGGFGIGLWLTNQLVTAMSGTIAVESAPGEGTIFAVALPVGDAEQMKAKSA